MVPGLRCPRTWACLRPPDRALAIAARRPALVFSGLGSVGIFNRRTAPMTERWLKKSQSRSGRSTASVHRIVRRLFWAITKTPVLSYRINQMQSSAKRTLLIRASLKMVIAIQAVSVRWGKVFKSNCTVFHLEASSNSTGRARDSCTRRVTGETDTSRFDVRH
jgi:hypothetical protein